MTVRAVERPADLRGWFGDHVEELRAFVPVDGESLDDRVARGAAMLGFLHGAGVMGRGWPEAWGGAGGTAIDRALVYDLLVRSGLDLPESLAPLEVLGSALSAYAPELAATHVPRVLRGQELWCQGFSEPDAGSDLASLRTRAHRSAEGWVLTGQKVWTSLGHLADYCGVLARTGTTDERHRGLTLFWVDMRADGVGARPLQTLTGEDEFAEVFLDEVVVDDSCVIGEVGQGWAVAMHLLQYERGMWAWQRQAMLHQALEIAMAHDEMDEVPVDAIGHAFCVLSSVRARSARTIERLSRGEIVGPEVSIDKILLGRAEQAVNDVVRLALGRDFATSDAAAAERARGAWFYSRAASIYGGAVEVQLDLVAQRVIGLPRGTR
ncbi:acyl-CoA dehydrogenase [Nocardioides immobilis]|uniref:Acyl-CoA dehydrogenase n=1 Tax=Nocardioides immobilis TaxID=2049295 RepID=A0A417Y0Q9_9ACTN|nr:acyl-CoA dehydrogenase family protein [Nocardioides immobilis]RHW26213.1 acyl-CoA dehydrogenase [Nocardioides immobilis]